MQNQEKENQTGHSRSTEFRAWFKKEKEMREVAMLRWENGRMTRIAGYRKDTRNNGWTDYDPQEGNIVLIEYTNLKDKNGKKIFEGDIIKAGDGERSLVEWVKGCVVARHYRNGESQDCDFIASRNVFEILGNIYEHPKLLSDNNK